MQLQKLPYSVKRIKELKYVELMALVENVNRPPGGRRVITKIVRLLRISKDWFVLDVGSNTGYVSFEIWNQAEPSIIGIDISEEMIKSAYQKREQYAPNSGVVFLKMDALNMSFGNNTFDLVISGGSTPFTGNITKALQEYVRVTKHWKFIADINFFFHTPPPTNLIKHLSKTIETKIETWDFNWWYKKYTTIEGTEIYHIEKGIMEPVTKKEIDEYVEYLLKPYKESKAKVALRKRLMEIYTLFNEVHKYLGYGAFILRKRPFKEIILFKP